LGCSAGNIFEHISTINIWDISNSVLKTRIRKYATHSEQCSAINNTKLSFQTDLAPPKPVTSLSSVSPLTKTDIASKSSYRMSQNDKFFGCFLPHLSERSTDHGCEHFPLGKWDQRFAWPWFKRSACGAPRRTALVFVGELYEAHVSLALNPRGTRDASDRPSATSEKTVTKKCFFFHIIEDNRPNLERSNLYRRCVIFVYVCFPFVFYALGYFTIHLLENIFMFAAWGAETRRMSTFCRDIQCSC
jgi:hypothetical protein